MTTPREFLPPRRRFADEYVAKLGAYLDGQDRIVAAWNVTESYPSADGSARNLQDSLQLELREPQGDGAAEPALFMGLARELPMPPGGLGMSFPPATTLPPIRDVGERLWAEGEQAPGRDHLDFDLSYTTPSLPNGLIEDLRAGLAGIGVVERAYFVNHDLLKDGKRVESHLKLHVQADVRGRGAARSLLAEIRTIVGGRLSAWGIACGAEQPEPCEEAILVIDRGPS